MIGLNVRTSICVHSIDIMYLLSGNLKFTFAVFIWFSMPSLWTPGALRGVTYHTTPAVRVGVVNLHLNSM
jgi:hypothetical protein